MIISKFDDLRRAKALREQRDLSVRAVARETGLSINTLQRMRRQQPERVYLSTLDTLCAYFALRHVGEIIEYVPNEGRQEENHS